MTMPQQRAIPTELPTATTGPYYHVTFASRVAKIEREGLVPGKKRVWSNTFGAKLGEAKTLYVFSNPAGAVRWAAKMQYDFQKPVVILTITDVPGPVERDHGMGFQDMTGSACKTRTAVPASAIVKATPLTLEITRAVIADQPVSL